MNTQEWRNATPEQLAFWACAKDLIAWNKITPLYYVGPTAGSEFLTYAATKIYIALELDFSYSLGAGGGGGLVTVYNQANVLCFYLMNCAVAVEAADTQVYSPNNVRTKNISFGKILSGGYDFMKFVGYKLTNV